MHGLTRIALLLLPCPITPFQFTVALHLIQAKCNGLSHEKIPSYGSMSDLMNKLKYPFMGALRVGKGTKGIKSTDNLRKARSLCDQSRPEFRSLRADRQAWRLVRLE